MGIEYLRGDIVYTNLEPSFGHEQGGRRPALIIQNNIGNKFSPLTIVAPITKKIPSKSFPTSVFLSKSSSGLNFDSSVDCSQIKAIDKSRIINKLTTISQQNMKDIDKALKISLALN